MMMMLYGNHLFLMMLRTCNLLKILKLFSFSAMEKIEGNGSNKPELRQECSSCVSLAKRRCVGCISVRNVLVSLGKDIIRSLVFGVGIFRR